MDPPAYRLLTRGENFSTRYKVVADESFDNIVVLDGVPIIDSARREKLLTKISREFGKRGSTISPNDIIVPWDDSVGRSKGYVHFLPRRFILTSNTLGTFSSNLRIMLMQSTQ